MCSACQHRPELQPHHLQHCSRCAWNDGRLCLAVDSHGACGNLLHLYLPDVPREVRVEEEPAVTDTDAHPFSRAPHPFPSFEKEGIVFRHWITVPLFARLTTRYFHALGPSALFQR